MTPSDNALKEISKTLISIDKSLKTIANHLRKVETISETTTWFPDVAEYVYGPYGHGTGDIATADTQNINFS